MNIVKRFILFFLTKYFIATDSEDIGNLFDFCFKQIEQLNKLFTLINIASVDFKHVAEFCFAELLKNIIWGNTSAKEL